MNDGKFRISYLHQQMPGLMSEDAFAAVVPVPAAGGWSAAAGQAQVPPHQEGLAEWLPTEQEQPGIRLRGQRDTVATVAAGTLPRCRLPAGG